MDMQARESRLFETVRLIREWIEASFEPAIEERFFRTGRLKARFDVDLGSQMCEQLQLYAKASFALSRLQFRLTERERPGGGVPRPCVEVLLTEAARQLYAEKHPDAVAKRRTGLHALQDGTESQKPSSKAAGTTALADEPRLALPGGSASGHVSATAPSSGTQAISLSGAHKEAEHDKAKKQRTGRGDRGLQGASVGASDTTGSTSTSVGSKRPLEAETHGPQQLPGKSLGKPPTSIWEAVPPREVPPGLEGLREAKEALDAGLRVGGTLAVLKAEKEAVGWLKGLAARGLGPAELRETLVGQAVNAWRKHSEPYIASLAVELLRTWKAAWREAEADVRRRTPCSSLAVVVAK